MRDLNIEGSFVTIFLNVLIFKNTSETYKQLAFLGHVCLIIITIIIIIIITNTLFSEGNSWSDTL